MASSDDPRPHFLLVPLMLKSHLIPFSELAKLLALQGATVTIVTTPLNAGWFNAIIDSSTDSNLNNIQFLSLPFPCKEAGLPEGCESINTLPSQDLVPRFLQASSMLQGPLEEWLQGLQPPLPSCVISDLVFRWTHGVAVKFKIPRVVFHTISCFTLLYFHNIGSSQVLESITDDAEPFLVPGLPDKLEVTKAQLPLTFLEKNPDDPYNDIQTCYVEAESTADGLLVNTFEELEPSYVKEYQKVAKKVWCVGPVFLPNKTTFNKSDRSDKASVDEAKCLKWLDSKSPNRVIYVCFGSLCNFSLEQLVEIGLGLEASHCPFIWVIGKGDYSTELDNWFREDKFEDRLNGRGLVIRRWAPQVQILSHPSVGGFLTHCGWSSILEGACAGLPMLTWPLSSEQFLNEKLIVQVLKTGVPVGVKVSVEWAKEKQLGALVKREDVKKAVNLLMDGGDEGQERRTRARQLREIANNVLKEGGSSYSNLTSFIQHFMDPSQP